MTRKQPSTPGPPRKRNYRAERRAAVYAEREAAAGRPMRVPHEPAKTRRDLLRSLGLTDWRIAELAGIHQTTVSQLGITPNCHRDTANGILAINPDDVAGPDPHKRIPATGMIRIIGGLMCYGYSLNWTSNNLMYDHPEQHRGQGNHAYAHAFLSGKHATVEWSTFTRFHQVAQKYETVNPLDVGMQLQQVSRSKNYARKHGFVPLSCWDDDTINDPNAFPEWTGECGTLDGYYLHLQYGMQVRVRPGGTRADGTAQFRKKVLCDPCLTAKRQAGRTLKGRATAKRAEALDLLAQGHTPPAVAARLGYNERTVYRIRDEMGDQ